MKQNKVLVVAAHPDDEVLGCGGTTAWHAKQGDIVYVLILGEGITARDAVRNYQKHEKDLFLLKDIAYQANVCVLGASLVETHNFPDNRMDSLDRLDIVKVVENFIKKYHPNIVYTHHAGDVNIDHRRVHEAVVTACRPIPDCSVKRVLFFEIASSTEWQPYSSAPYFMPNWFIDITYFKTN